MEYIPKPEKLKPNQFFFAFFNFAKARVFKYKKNNFYCSSKELCPEESICSNTATASIGPIFFQLYLIEVHLRGQSVLKYVTRCDFTDLPFVFDLS